MIVGIGKLNNKLPMRDIMNINYILIDHDNNYVDNFYKTFEEAMEASACLIQSGASLSHAIMEVNILGVLKDLPWGELVWEAL